MGYTRLRHYGNVEFSDSFKQNVTKFIREYCEDLRFDPKIDEKEKREGVLFGASRSPRQIPYNMQMDIDRLCLERALLRFFDSGKKEDAFDVYFCYLEMFVGDYCKTRRMIELLSEYEANGSGILMKHRDHYSHSVYVFSLGLAIYVSSPLYRQTYQEYYGIEDKNEAACHFLEFWGMTSLFHDIGYPFELPFEQISSYFEVQDENRAKRPYLAYHGLESLIRLDVDMQKDLKIILGLKENDILETTEDLFAWDLYLKMGRKYSFSKDNMKTFISAKPVNPNLFNHYMDHAYFSATVLFRKLFCEMKNDIKKEHIDSLTAILLHNSLYKFCVAKYKEENINHPLEMRIHPLAYMLMLCDELQCWDRTAYGRNSKHELHPMEVELDLSEADCIRIKYFFDLDEKEKIEKFEEEYKKWSADKTVKMPKLKAYSSMYQRETIKRKDGSEVEVSGFQADIERIVDLTGLKLDVKSEIRAKNSNRHKFYLSDSDFMSLYNFAAALNARWSGRGMDDKKMYEALDRMSLEYKLSNINQAKSFSKYLNEIGAFYTNRSVDFKMLVSFNKNELAVIGPLEHRRWLEEHYEMGWKYISKEELQKTVKDETGIDDINSTDFKNAFNAKREIIRKHWDMIPDLSDVDKQALITTGDLSEETVKNNYDRIGQAEQDKDTAPMELMIELLKKFDGLRIYRLDEGEKNYGIN